jgi:hypothetical protein
VKRCGIFAIAAPAIMRVLTIAIAARFVSGL